jgi:uncharacterized protein (DUF1330 family)
MKTPFTVALSMLAGAALGAGAIHGLHAQAKPSVYLITEIAVSNQDAYTKEYVPRATAAIKEAGGRYLVQGGKIQVFDGEAPAGRVVVTVWDSAEKIQAWRNSAAFKELLPLRDKYAKFRSFSVEGLPQ